jgi:hypothetical protein
MMFAIHLTNISTGRLKLTTTLEKHITKVIIFRVYLCWLLLSSSNAKAHPTSSGICLHLQGSLLTQRNEIHQLLNKGAL